MANSCGFHRCTTWQTLIIFSMVAAYIADGAAEGQDHCGRFSCGNLHNISFPFRRPGDPHDCGEPAYELACSSRKATIRINNRTYFVTSINYTDWTFWVQDANLDMNSSCPLPRWDQFPYHSGEGRAVSENGMQIDLTTAAEGYWACFVSCSKALKDNMLYKPVDCLSTSTSFVYASVSDGSVRSLKPFCGYLSMIPVGRSPDPYQWDGQYENTSYEGIIEMVKKGFPVGFPLNLAAGSHRLNASWVYKTCLKNSTTYFHKQLSGAGILKWARAFFGSEVIFAECVEYYITVPWYMVAIVSAMDVTKSSLVLFRFVLPALAVWAFLAHKYWKTRITIDAVEKFLRMQQMVGPMRYAYTDITAITGHFRDKLGQGGYGSVYKGVLHPGGLRVAVKMLGNSNCNGDDFISEVSTIGGIHHINVVRLMGFCAEDMRRALVYEYMPHGSLDKYIFSSERSFSWDKLNDIALGIARGIDYLHRGCDMQILHFDIKPHNVLLDINFVPKIADFGLAKLYPRDKSFVPMSAFRGTIGYVAPEIYNRSFGAISRKSDVYSFGMLLLEMAGGRRNSVQNAAAPSQVYYPSWVYDQLAKQEAGEISSAAVADMHELERKLCIVGLRCIQMKPQGRPTMSEVIEMLEFGADDGLTMPPRPFFCDNSDDYDHGDAADSYRPSSEMTEILEGR